MKQDRRMCLKTTALMGAVAATGSAVVAPVPAAAQAAGSPSMPKAMTFATLKNANSYGLGLRTDRGILDVAVAEMDLRENAPITIDAVFKGQGDIAGLRRLIDKAKASTADDRYFIPEAKAEFGPCGTNPEKIVCIGLNYRRHAAEVGQPVPKMPILFNKYN